MAIEVEASALRDEVWKAINVLSGINQSLYRITRIGKEANVDSIIVGNWLFAKDPEMYAKLLAEGKALAEAGFLSEPYPIPEDPDKDARIRWVKRMAIWDSERLKDNEPEHGVHP